jgi:hypothetical protein
VEAASHRRYSLVLPAVQATRRRIYSVLQRYRHSQIESWIPHPYTSQVQMSLSGHYGAAVPVEAQLWPYTLKPTLRSTSKSRWKPPLSFLNLRLDTMATDSAAPRMFLVSLLRNRRQPCGRVYYYEVPQPRDRVCTPECTWVSLQMDFIRWM